MEPLDLSSGGEDNLLTVMDVLNDMEPGDVMEERMRLQGESPPSKKAASYAEVVTAGGKMTTRGMTRKEGKEGEK